MGRFDGRVVWITGGGSGIGAACARRFAAEGAKVVVSGRRAEKLDHVVTELKGTGAIASAVVCDVSTQDACDAAVAEILGEYGQLDVVLANAGYAVGGKMLDVTDAEWRRQFDVNVFGLLNTVRAAREALRETRGQIGLVASVASFLPTPGSGVYATSKAAVRMIGDTLAVELAAEGIAVTTIHPGFVESEIGQVDNEGVFREDWKDRRPGALMWTSEAAAKVMVRGLAKRQRELVFTGHGKAAVAMSRMAPSLTHFIVARTQS